MRHVQAANSRDPARQRTLLAWSTNLKENGKSYYTFIECSLNGQFLQTLDNYPGMIDDFRADVNP